MRHGTHGTGWTRTLSPPPALARVFWAAAVSYARLKVRDLELFDALALQSLRYAPSAPIRFSCTPTDGR
jgi:hypothetical protein